MGDCGSLSLGSSLGLLAIILKQELAFAIMSGIFIAEVLSVIIQVASFKMRKGNEFSRWHHSTIITSFQDYQNQRLS